MGYTLNTTHEYHRHRLKSLGWELTVCNALYPENSLCRGVLKSNASFGEHLFDFLQRIIPFPALTNVLEVGGGLGYLMKDFLRLAPHLQATMLDISPFLLQKQKEALAGLPARFVEMDFLKVTAAQIHSFDLAIFNENLGDFPTLVYNQNGSKEDNEGTTRSLNKIFDYEEEYSLEFTPTENINIGAMEVVERLCGAAIPYIYLSEHSCETSVDHPSLPHLKLKASGSPERIDLQGHSEYTVKFSHLETIARAFHYKVFRGQYRYILPIDFNDKVKAALRSPTPLSDEQEIIQHFVYDLYKYEYMVLVNDARSKVTK